MGHLTPCFLPYHPISALQWFGKTQAQMYTVVTKITLLHRCETSHASRHLHHHLDFNATEVTRFIRASGMERQIEIQWICSNNWSQVNSLHKITTLLWFDLHPFQDENRMIKISTSSGRSWIFHESRDIYQVVVSLIYFDAKKLKIETLRLKSLKKCLLSRSLVKHFFRQAPIGIWMLRLATVLKDLDIGQCCWVLWPPRHHLSPICWVKALMYTPVVHVLA